MEKEKLTQLQRRKRYLLKIIFILLGYVLLIWFSRAGIFRQGVWVPKSTKIQTTPTADSPDFKEQFESEKEG